MKFMVDRTSAFDLKPCKEAVKEHYIRHDRRNVSRPNLIPYHAGKSEDWWYTEGQNHRIDNNQIVRDFIDEAYFIDIEDMDSLLQFTNKYGKIVIQPVNPYGRHDFMELEIYDDYRE